MVDISVIVLSYNTKDMTQQCLTSLIAALNKSTVSYEIIVVDNASADGSWEMLKEYQISRPKGDHPMDEKIKIIKNRINVGYPRGNNQGVEVAQGRYILFLNSDVLIKNVDFKKIIDFLKKDGNIAVLTVKVQLPSGKIDPASHRGFPTLWNSFCYFSKLEKFTSKISLLNRIFGGYHLTYQNLNDTHEIDSPSGAFYLVDKRAITEVGGFDEDFFMYGEDLDLSYRIKKIGYKIVYFPFGEVLHLKWASGLKTQSHAIRLKTREYFYQAMKIFYEKHYARSHPAIINKLVYYLIGFKQRLA